MTGKKTVSTKATNATPLTRNELRAALLGGAPKPQRRTITLFGQEIEVRQPDLRGILDAQKVTDEKERATGMIIQYAYVPGTNERVFEEADKDVILSWPFTSELVDLQVTIAEMTGIDYSAAEAVLKEDPLSKQS